MNETIAMRNQATEVSKLLGTFAAISTSSGLELYNYLSSKISKGEYVTLSFKDMRNCTSAFFNNSIGKLYLDFDPNTVDKLMKFIDINNQIWEYKLNQAIKLGSNPKIIDSIDKSIIEEYGE